MSRGLGHVELERLTADSVPRQALTTSLSHPPVGERGTATLTPDPLEMIAEGKHSIEAICRESKMSILELATHVCTPRNLEALGRVAELHAIEREMLLGKLKRDALVRLAELTDEVPAGSADEIRAFEVMRKACRDLLRYGGVNTEKRQTRPEGPGGGGPRGYPGGYPGGGCHSYSITPAFEAEVLEALEKLGEVSEKAGGEEGVEKSRTRTRRVPPLKEATTRTGGTPMPPAPPRDGAIEPGQSRPCPGCRGGGYEGQAVPGTRHGIVGLDHAHPP